MSIFIPLRGHSKAIVIPSAAQRSCGILLSTTSDETQSPLRNRNASLPLSSRRDLAAPVKTGGEDGGRGPIPFFPFVASFPRRVFPLEDRGGNPSEPVETAHPLTHSSPLPLSSRRVVKTGGRGPIPYSLFVSSFRRRAGIQGWGIVPPIIKTLAASPKQAFALQGEK